MHGSRAVVKCVAGADLDRLERRADLAKVSRERYMGA